MSNRLSYEPVTHWISHAIKLPSGQIKSVGAISYQEWLKQTDTNTMHNRLFVFRQEDREYLETLRQRVADIVDQLKPGESFLFEGLKIQNAALAPIPKDEDDAPEMFVWASETTEKEDE